MLGSVGVMSLVARLSLVAAVLSGAVLVLLPGLSVAADTIQVAVVDEAPEYRDGNADGNDSPSHTVITAGDAVVWRWADGNENQHTVTSRADSEKQFDSDSDCEGEDTWCREGGNIFVVRFEEPGTYPYYCKLHSGLGGLTGATGTIEVQPAPEPSESETTSDQPSDDGSSEPSGSESSPPPSDGGSSEPDDAGSSEPEPEPEPQDDPSSPQPQETSSGDAGSNDDRPPRRTARGPGFGVRQQPESTEPGVSPEVAPEAVPEPSFSPFPSAPELPSESETDMAVNVPAPEGGGPARGVLVGVAVASVIGSAGAFGKVVLFGRPWG
ncbi:MAG: hypothetical protein KY437_06405 [Actinobacteria bacterium]|nr:hypothetical protein [Actinomycetota bacterium]